SGAPPGCLLILVVIGIQAQDTSRPELAVVAEFNGRHDYTLGTSTPHRPVFCMMRGKAGRRVMPNRRFAELNRGIGRRAACRIRLPALEESVIGRIAMRRMPSSARRIRTRRARPVLEGLEGRRLLSNGVFSHSGREFTYTTPTGGRAVIKIVGIGDL